VDDREFEELTKAMADGQSRRRIVKILGAGVLSGLTGLFGSRGETDARKRKARAQGKRKARAEGEYPTTTTTKKPTTTTTTTKKPTTTTTTTKKPKFCGHSTGQNGGCKGACTSAGFTGQQCNPICGNGQFRGACPVGQGGNNPCCNTGYCDPDNFVTGANGNPVYVGPTTGCPPA
jgi:hypothetical protein